MSSTPYRVRGAGHVGSAFDGRKRGREQHEQKTDDANDDQQFEQGKSLAVSNR
jgi:hypothetical protein